MSWDSSNMVVVLHQIRSPDNLGAVARLMANFGLSRLVVSDPVTHAFSAAQKLAVGGESVLSGMYVAKDLEEAVGRVTFACGTTSRRDLRRQTPRSPEEALTLLAQRAQSGRVALVFGGEKRGLSDDELALCQEVLTIPTAAQQPSMNLSQSAAVLLYLWSRVVAPRPALSRAPPAKLHSLQALEQRAQRALSDAGFLNLQAPHHVLRELMRTLEREELTEREVGLWLSAFGRLQGGRERAR
jgi:tRNA/rRNA methyltransferase